MRYLIIILILLFSSLSYAKTEDSEKHYKQFKDIFDKVEALYVEEPDKDKLIESALKGMLHEIDPHSSFLTKKEHDELLESTKGEFSGVGIEIMYENNLIYVISPIDDLPADRAGVKPGDRIFEIDGELVSDLGFIPAVYKMRGKTGTKVKLSILRDGEAKPIKLELKREIVKVDSVKSNLDNNIGYIRISSFTDNTMDELRKAARKIQTESKDDLKGLILDLRNNPGGLLPPAVAVSDFFLESGDIVSIKGRARTKDVVFSVSQFAAKAPNLPLVVLINNGSASGSEIVAGAIQDNKRGIILGTKSFGKGSVQTVFPTETGALRITTDRYFTPSGRSIQADGIEPDIIVEPAKIEFLKPIDEKDRYSEANLKNHLENADKDKNKKQDPKKRSEREAKIMSEMYKKDYQYARAHDIITSLAITTKQRASE